MSKSTSRVSGFAKPRQLIVVLVSLLLFSGCTSASEIVSSPAIKSPAPPATVSGQKTQVTIVSAQITETATLAPVDPGQTPSATPEIEFSGEDAYDHLLAQMEFGPRWPGSDGHQAAGDYIVAVLASTGWQVEEQRFPYLGLEGRNIIGRSNVAAGPVTIIGAHYDTRKIADKSPGTTEPVPGAVDGASGVAVLLELAAVLQMESVDNEIWLTFFDLEDQGSGGMPNFDWIVGSSYLAANLTVTPEAMVLVDMVGDADQQLYYERNSDPALREELWSIAADLGFGSYFIPEEKHSLIDDHLPFVYLGIPAVDIIDFDYTAWHTVNDTSDKASPQSLFRVGRTLEEWLEGN